MLPPHHTGRTAEQLERGKRRRGKKGKVRFLKFSICKILTCECGMSQNTHLSECQPSSWEQRDYRQRNGFPLFQPISQLLIFHWALQQLKFGNMGKVTILSKELSRSVRAGSILGRVYFVWENYLFPKGKPRSNANRISYPERPLKSHAVNRSWISHGFAHKNMASLKAVSTLDSLVLSQGPRTW